MATPLIEMESATEAKIIEVFKTNVTEQTVSEQIIRSLKGVFPAARVNFDLSDRDKILRIEADVPDFDVNNVLQVVRNSGFYIELLD